MAAANMETYNTEGLNGRHQEKQLAFENLATATTFDRNTVRSLTKTIARLTTELAAANSDIRRLCGNTFPPHLPPQPIPLHTPPPRKPFPLRHNAKISMGYKGLLFVTCIQSHHWPHIQIMQASHEQPAQGECHP